MIGTGFSRQTIAGVIRRHSANRVVRTLWWRMLGGRWVLCTARIDGKLSLDSWITPKRAGLRANVSVARRPLVRCEDRFVSWAHRCGLG